MPYGGPTAVAAWKLFSQDTAPQFIQVFNPFAEWNSFTVGSNYANLMALIHFFVPISMNPGDLFSGSSTASLYVSDKIETFNLNSQPKNAFLVGQAKWVGNGTSGLSYGYGICCTKIVSLNENGEFYVGNSEQMPTIAVNGFYHVVAIQTVATDKIVIIP